MINTQQRKELILLQVQGVKHQFQAVLIHLRDFADVADGKASNYDVGDPGSIPGLGSVFGSPTTCKSM